MRVSMVAAMVCLGAAAVIAAFAYAPDMRRASDALRRRLRALTHRPRHH